MQITLNETMFKICIIWFGGTFFGGILRLLVQNEQFVESFRKALGL